MAHGSTVQPWNRGAKPWPTVPRFNRGTVEPNRGPGAKPWPRSQTVAHGFTVPRPNRGTVNRGTVETVNRTVSTVPRSRLESARRRPSRLVGDPSLGMKYE